MRHPLLYLVMSAVVSYFYGCQSPQRKASYTAFANLTTPNEFAAYWYQGQAELSSYDLQINRYGEMRHGEAIMIFVTEDLSRSRQVRLDSLEEAGDDKVAVMKFNKIWKFRTGLYDYSLMGSIFTPLDLNQYPYSLKENSTLQDWSGQSFHQLNREKEGYLVNQFSYYETEGDQSYSIKPDLLEDELFNRLRINPASVPSGELEIVPGDFFLHLGREQVKPKRARIQFLESEATTQCLVEYLHLDRTVRINFESAFPHKILSWTEEESQRVVVEGKLRKTVREAFWTKNAGDFLPLRDSLELTY